MAGHNKWAQIKHKKAVTDAKKSKIFSKLARLISVEAKLAKGDRNAPGLRTAIEKAKRANMPSENIERAIKKASESEAQMEAVTYEAYGPGGTGIIIEALSDNRNRAVQEIKHALSENGFSLSAPGSVVWAFKKEKTGEGVNWKPTTSVTLSENDLNLLDKLVDALENIDDVQEVFTNAK